MGFRRALITALCIALAALAGVGVLSYQRVAHDADDEQWVAHTHQVLETLAALRINLTNAEAGERGFIITGEDTYLSPYRAGLEGLRWGLATAKSLTKDNPLQQHALDQMEPRVSAKLAELQDTIAVRQNEGLDAGVRAMKQSSVKRTADSIRGGIGDMEQEERRLLSERLERAQLGFVRTEALIVTGNGIALCFLALAGVAIYREMYRRHKTEEELRLSNARAEAVNKELQAFSYSVSHDLRAPLRGIDGFSLALLEDYADKLDEDGKDFLRRIRNATMRMGKLIDNLLELARMTRTELLSEEVDLSSLAEEVAAQCRAAEPERKADIVIAPGMTISGDRVLMRAMLENLIGNAWKYTSKKSQAYIELGVNRSGNGNVYFVRDNGAGFDMRYASKLFGIFQRLHDASEFPGTGVGLATVQRIVTRHNGKVWAESKPGEGATFYFQMGGAR